nr:MAG TPA: hypothetical protein [Caudoviricetes sp.]
MADNQWCFMQLWIICSSCLSHIRIGNRHFSAVIVSTRAGFKNFKQLFHKKSPIGLMRLF